MKFNFRKISAMAASAVMLVGTAGIAAAANYPAPFITANTASAGIVVGEAANILDSVQAANVKADLGARATGGTTTTTSCAGGDCFLFELASTKLNMNNTLVSVRSSSLDDDNLPSVLQELEYRSGDSKTYKYDQRVTMSGDSTTGLTFTAFVDSDHNDKIPDVGIKVKDGKAILNYTVAWKKKPESDVDSSNRLEDLENSQITLLGKEYTILNAYNASSNSDKTKLELMGGAVVDDINFGETETHTVEGKSYAVRLAHIEDTEAKLCVSIDGATEECQSNLAKGETFELSDGVQVGVRNINYVSKTGRTDSVDFSLGAQKITLETNSTVEVNDVDVNGLTTEFHQYASGGKDKLTDIIFIWQADDDLFIAGDAELELPALGGLKISSGGFYQPAAEMIEVNPSGDRTLELKVPIKSGTATIPILYTISNGTNFGWIGGDSDDVLATGNSSVIDNSPQILFNYSAGDRKLVASWNSSTDAESYYLSIGGFSTDSGDGENFTTITDEVTGTAVCKDYKNTDTCTLGNVVLTLGVISKKDRTVALTLNNGGSFNRLYSEEGMVVYLPVASNGTGDANLGNDVNPSYINLTMQHRVDGMGNVPRNATQWLLTMVEEDKNGNLGAGETINFTLDMDSDGETRVNDVRAKFASSTGYGTSNPGLETEDDSEKFIEWIYSDVGTKVLHSRVSSSQYDAEVTYPGGESYGLIYLADDSADISSTESVTTTATGDFVLVLDNEVSSVASKDLIIIGGSCINSAAANVLDVALGTCGAAWEEATGVGSGEFLIQSFGDAYASGKVAVLVAGYNAEDTELAAEALTSEVIDTAAGMKYTGGVSAELTKVVAEA